MSPRNGWIPALRGRVEGPLFTPASRLRSERGATAVEYGLMLMFITIVIFAAVVFLSDQTSSTFNCTAESVRQAAVRC